MTVRTGNIDCKDRKYNIPFTDIKGVNLVFRFEADKSTKPNTKQRRKNRSKADSDV